MKEQQRKEGHTESKLSDGSHTNSAGRYSQTVASHQLHLAFHNGARGDKQAGGG